MPFWHSPLSCGRLTANSAGQDRSALLCAGEHARKMSFRIVDPNAVHVAFNECWRAFLSFSSRIQYPLRLRCINEDIPSSMQVAEESCVRTAPGEITYLLLELKRGNKDAEGKLIPLVYRELRRIAAAYMRRESLDHSLQPTALVDTCIASASKIPTRLGENHSFRRILQTSGFAIFMRLAKKSALNDAARTSLSSGPSHAGFAHRRRPISLSRSSEFR
jgi:hypothetical protein